MSSLEIIIGVEDEVKGFYALMRKYRITCLPENVYLVPKDALKLLDDAKIKYKIKAD